MGSAEFNTSSLVESSNITKVCVQLTDRETYLYSQYAWWMEVVAQVVVGCIGFVGNVVAVPVLLDKNNDLCNIFGRILSCLAIVDNVFITCAISEVVRKYRHTYIHQWLFGNFIYQFSNMTLCCSTYLTVILAMERHKAIWKPVEYRNNVLTSSHPWRRVFAYVLPVMAFSVLFNLPKFFEYDASLKQEVINVTDETTNMTRTETTSWVHFEPVLRLNETYMFWYQNVTRLLVNGIIPLFLMAFFNTRIYQMLKKRGHSRTKVERPKASAKEETSFSGASKSKPLLAQLSNAAIRRGSRGVVGHSIGNGNHPGGDKGRSSSEETAKQAVVLFTIVAIFVFCNFIRIAMNVYDLVYIKEIKESRKNGCAGYGLMMNLAYTTSHFLITFNASINFFIYCLMSYPFRNTLKIKFQASVPSCLIKWFGENRIKLQQRRAAKRKAQQQLGGEGNDVDDGGNDCGQTSLTLHSTASTTLQSTTNGGGCSGGTAPTNHITTGLKNNNIQMHDYRTSSAENKSDLSPHTTRGKITQQQINSVQLSCEGDEERPCDGYHRDKLVSEEENATPTASTKQNCTGKKQADTSSANNSTITSPGLESGSIGVGQKEQFKNPPIRMEKDTKVVFV